MLNKKTIQTVFAAFAFTMMAFATTSSASAAQSEPTLANQQVQMAMLAEMVNTSALAALSPRENGDTLTFDAIDKQFNNTDETEGNENLVAASSEEDGC